VGWVVEHMVVDGGHDRLVPAPRLLLVTAICNPARAAVSAPSHTDSSGSVLYADFITLRSSPVDQ
jgi:hypothetical protein